FKVSGADQVIPILETQGRLVHDIIGENRRNGKVRNLKLVGGEVAGSQITLACGLIVQAVVALGGIAQIGAVLVVEPVINASVVARIEIGSGNNGSHLG